MNSFDDIPFVRECMTDAMATGDARLHDILSRVETAILLESPGLWNESLGDLSDLLILERGVWLTFE